MSPQKSGPGQNWGLYMYTPPPAAATLKLPLYATECYATCCRISFWSSVVVHVHHDAWPIYFVMEMFIHHEGRYTKYNAR